jgi:hypothetical protein
MANVSVDCIIENNFDINELNELENKMNYLLKSIQKRKTELKPEVKKLELNKVENVEMEGKLYTALSVSEIIDVKDTKGKERRLYGRYKQLEYCKILSENKKEINAKIKELKVKYNISKVAKSKSIF